jgi:acyl-CoA synthetase (AMP-forming)/AMP-acid ligase II
VQVLITSPERLALLLPVLSQCPSVRHVVLTSVLTSAPAEPQALPPGITLHTWADLLAAAPLDSGVHGHRVIDTDLCAILYTSGSTGRPKGVVLSHRNMMAGAKSVASYLENSPQDTLLAALPLSFDAGFSQLTTAFHSGARVVLLNYLLPRDVLKTMAREKVTGLTAVPPLYIQLSQLEWPPEIDEHLRYFANTGGRMPRETLTLLRQRVHKAKPFLMYGLTEAFRSTFLPPEEVDRRPDRTASARPFSMPKLWCGVKTAANAPPMSRVNWCTAAPWWARATGATPRRRQNATNRCHPAWAGGKPHCNCPSTPCFQATPCAAMPRAFCTSSAASTR